MKKKFRNFILIIVGFVIIIVAIIGIVLLLQSTDQIDITDANDNTITYSRTYRRFN